MWLPLVCEIFYLLACDIIYSEKFYIDQVCARIVYDNELHIGNFTS